MKQMQMDEYVRRGPGRPREGGKDTWKLYLPNDIALFWRLALTDTNTGRIPAGKMSGLVERLLREEKVRVENKREKEVI